MREAMIVWGGWSGPRARARARNRLGHVAEHGFKVRIETSTEAFADPALADLSLIVPIITMAKIEKDELANLTRPCAKASAWPAFTAGCAMPFATRSTTSS